MKRSRAKRASAVEESAVAGHRYTGPELSALLDQVRRELGAEASIVAADRIRQGGVAGFFATETFEVVASPGPVGRVVADDPAADAAVDPASDPRRSPMRSRPHTPSNQESVSLRPTRTLVESGAPASEHQVATALLERADAVSSQERQETGQRTKAATYDLRDQAAARQSTDGVGPSGFRFSEVLEATLHETVFDDDEAPISGIPAVPAPVLGTALDTTVDTGAGTVATPDGAFAEPVLPGQEPTSEEPAFRRVTDREPRVSAPPAGYLEQSIERCWSRLIAVDGMFAHRSVDAPIVAIVGELESAVAVANRLIADEAEPYTELVVFAPEHKRTPHQSSSILYHHADVREKLFHWTINELQGVVVIDAAFGEDLRVEVQRARNHGCALVRLAYTDDVSACRILSQLEYIGGRVVADVVPKTDRRQVETLVQCGIPVVSIGGRTVDPGMLFALANGVGDG